ncbi:MAG: cytidine deaminase [Patescibacteria group bacterium]|jgi:cytidine deaminase
MLSIEEIRKLIEVAQLYRLNAFVPLTDHPIGASVLATNGEYFGGCNTESYISGLGTCAERSAVDHAVSHGKYEFKAIAIVDDVLTYPCGACLQYLVFYSQIIETDIDIVVADIQGKYLLKTLNELLPNGYRTHQNLEKLKSYRNKP